MRAKTNSRIANAARSPHSLDRMVLLLGEADRITAAWKKDHQRILSDVGWSMRLEREAWKLSLRELARRLKITPPYLSDMELGRRKYSIEWVRKAFAAMEQNK